MTNRNRVLIIEKLACVFTLFTVTTLHCAGIAEGSVVFDFAFGAPGTGIGEFTDANGLDVDGLGRTYVADTNNNRVQVFGATGGFLFQIDNTNFGGGAFNPIDVAVGPGGNVHVLGNQRVRVFDDVGVHQFEFGAPGTGIGEFTDANGLSIDTSGGIYVADTNNNRIQVFGNNGAFEFQIDSGNFGGGQFNPIDVEIGPSDGIHVLANQFVRVFDSEGVHQFGFGGDGTGIGELNNSNGLTVDSLGDIYVADTSNNRVQIFSDSGEFELQIDSSSFGHVQFNPHDVAIASSGAVHVLGNQVVRVFTIPEPGAMSLVCIGVTGLAVWRLRRRQR